MRSLIIFIICVIVVDEITYLADGVRTERPYSTVLLEYSRMVFTLCYGCNVSEICCAVGAVIAADNTGCYRKICRVGIAELIITVIAPHIELLALSDCGGMIVAGGYRYYVINSVRRIFKHLAPLVILSCGIVAKLTLRIYTNGIRVAV